MSTVPIQERGILFVAAARLGNGVVLMRCELQYIIYAIVR